MKDFYWLCCHNAGFSFSFCSCPGILHLDTALLVKWDTWARAREAQLANHMDYWHICLTVWRLLLINSLATSVPDRWIKAAVNTFISVILSSFSPFALLPTPACVVTSWFFLKRLSILFTVCFRNTRQLWWAKHNSEAVHQQYDSVKYWNHPD